MKVIYFCGHESLFGRQSLEALAESDLCPEVVVLGTATTWKRFDEQLNKNLFRGYRHRLRTWYYSNRNRRWVEQFARQHDIRLLWITDVNSPKGLQQLKSLEGDLFLCAAYPQILEQDWLDLPAAGAIGLHPSLLPAFRGAHPHFWVIRTGARETGLTAYRMTTRIDDGEILAQVKFPVAGKNYQDLYHHFREQLRPLLNRLSGVLLNGKSVQAENEGVAASYFSNNQPEDARVLWEKHSLEEIQCLLKTGIAWCIYRTRKLRLLEAETFPESTWNIRGIKAGQILVNDGQTWVRCKDGWLQLHSWRWHRLLFSPSLRPGSLMM